MLEVSCVCNAAPRSLRSVLPLTLMYRSVHSVRRPAYMALFVRSVGRESVGVCCLLVFAARSWIRGAKPHGHRLLCTEALV